jgi:hypothetical protein
MRWIRLWALLLLAFAAGHVAIATLVAGTPVWTARFWAQLAVVPAAEAGIVGWLLSRARASRERGAPR